MKRELMKIAKKFVSEEHTALVQASIKDLNKNLLPGMSVIANIQTGCNKVHALPESAFIKDHGKDCVFLL